MYKCISKNNKRVIAFTDSKSCQDEVLEDLVTAKSSEDPFTPIDGLSGTFMNNMTYSVSNVSNPLIQIVIDRHLSILGALYPKTELLFDSLQGNVEHNKSHWVINIQGKVKSCPGE